MTTYSEYKDLQSKQNAIVDMLSDKLNSYLKGHFGMVEESIRMSDEFKSVNSKYWAEFNKLRAINQIGVKKFKKEMRKDYEEKRKAKIKS